MMKGGAVRNAKRKPRPNLKQFFPNLLILETFGLFVLKTESALIRPVFALFSQL